MPRPLKLLVAVPFVLLAALVPVHAVIKVATFSTVLTEVAREVGGPQVEVISLLKPGVGPRHFKPSAADLKSIDDAQLILASGRGMETYLTEAAATAPKAKLIAVGDQITPRLWLARGSGPKIEDPHWWNSVKCEEQAIGLVRDALIAISPSDKLGFTQRAADYHARMEDLSRWASAQLAELPSGRRKLVTSFDAFQYFARDYDLQLFTVEDVTPSDSAESPKIARIISVLKAQQARAVFFEGEASPAVAAAIAKSANATVGGHLYPHGPDTGDATTYEKVFRHNVTAIVDALK